MDDGRSWRSTALRGPGGACAGLFVGGVVAGLVSTIIAGIIEASDSKMAGLSTEDFMIFWGSAGFAAAASIIAGAIGAVWRDPNRGLLAGGIAGFTVALCMIALAGKDTSSDPDWQYSLLILGVGPLVGAMTAGWVAGSMTSEQPEQPKNLATHVVNRISDSAGG